MRSETPKKLRTKIVRIGNSQGIRIPKALLEQTGLVGAVEIVVEGDSLLIRPLRQPRQGWEASFERMVESGDDALLLPDVPTAWDAEEWEWD